MRNCILGGDNFRAFRVDLGGQNSKGDNFQLYPSPGLGGHSRPMSAMAGGGGIYNNPISLIDSPDSRSGIS